MLFAVLTPLDYGLIILYLLAMVGLGLYFSGAQHTTNDFFFAGKSFGWFPLGISLMATLISALSYTGIPGQAYDVGLLVLIHPLAVWIGLPLMNGVVLPIYRGLALNSVYEYLELRFDARVRLLASGLFIVWRLLWLGGVIYAPCKVILIASGLNIPDWPLLVFLGLISTFYTFMGGMKAVIWTDVIQGLAMLGGVAVVIFGAWYALDGGPTRVTETASALGRLQPVDLTFDLTKTWSVWGALPHWVLAMLSFYIADQITAQRFLSAKDLNAAKTSFLANTVALSLLLPGLMYIGLCLLAFYQDHPEELRPEWVANIDPQTRKPLTDPATREKKRFNTILKQEEIDPTDGQPLLEWSLSTAAITAENLPRLIAERRLLRPNDGTPFESADELLDPDTGRVLVENLLQRRPNLDPHKAGKGEVILHKRANEEMLPRFLSRHLPWGAAGIIVAALLAASMSSIDSGVNSICSLLIVDLHRRYGVGRSWLANRLGKPVEQLNDADELKLAQPLTLAVGVAATLFALVVAQIGEIFDIMVKVVNTFGAPLLGVYLLGMFTRRCTAPAAFWSLVVGTVFTLWLMAAKQITALAWIWPLPWAMDATWTITVGTVFTFGLGFILSHFLGKPKSALELRGLVNGCGQLGVLAKDEEMPLITDPAGDQAIRWK